MVEKFCSKSHGQPVFGVRNAAMMSRRRAIWREGGIARGRSLITDAITPTSLPAKQRQISTDHAHFGLPGNGGLYRRPCRGAVCLGRHDLDLGILDLHRVFR